MRKHRFFTEQPLQPADTIGLDRQEAHHMRRVLRLEVGDIVWLFNNSPQQEYRAKIVALSNSEVRLQVLAACSLATESRLHIHLGQVLGKGQKTELVIQKAIELGVTSITPLTSARSLIKLKPDSGTQKVQHWQNIAINACKQCHRTVVPTVHPPLAFTAWLAQIQSPHRLIFAPNADLGLNALALSGDIAVVVGPEGGFTAEEISAATEHHFQPVRLGPRVLRCETAGICAIAALQLKFGDLGG